MARDSLLQLQQALAGQSLQCALAASKDGNTRSTKKPCSFPTTLLKQETALTKKEELRVKSYQAAFNVPKRMASANVLAKFALEQTQSTPKSNQLAKLAALDQNSEIQRLM